VAAILDISASVPKETIDKFLKACDGYKDKLGNSQAVAIRRGTIAFIKSIRARTPKSKKQAPMKDVTRYDGSGPHYITPKTGRFKGQALHRFNIKRKGGADTRVYVQPAESRADARARHGQYKKWGLAKKSWGWFMQSLFHRANPESGNPNAKIDSRMVECTPLREIVTGGKPRVEVMLVNKLDYIRDIVPDAEIDAAMRSATRSIETQIQEGLAKARKELT
jgi:hypothetical protein